MDLAAGGGLLLLDHGDGRRVARGRVAGRPELEVPPDPDRLPAELARLAGEVDLVAELADECAHCSTSSLSDRLWARQF